jgi:hypothetical protein
VVAQKFFPVEDVEGMYPLCERDYFARLDLICNQCDQALRSSYITACGKSQARINDASLIKLGNKYHVEHFTCTVCDVLFGPNDLYYEHGHKVCEYTSLGSQGRVDNSRLSLSLLNKLRGQMRGMRDGDPQTVRRDEQKWSG